MQHLSLRLASSLVSQEGLVPHLTSAARNLAKMAEPEKNQPEAEVEEIVADEGVKAPAFPPPVNALGGALGLGTNPAFGNLNTVDFSQRLTGLMQSPEVLAALQDKLGGMVGQQSGYIQNLPKPVKRRLKALKKLQFEMIKIESKFYEEVHELECKYAEKYGPLFERRKDVGKF